VPKTESAVDEMRTLRSDLDERLDDWLEVIGQTVGQRIDFLEKDTRGLRDELRSEIDRIQRRLRLLLIAVSLVLIGVLATLLAEVL
jgi:hypothetical protein